jgi:hypothetical protein
MNDPSNPSVDFHGERRSNRTHQSTTDPKARLAREGADKGYDRKEFVAELRDHQVTPHLACKATTIIDERTTRHPGYLISQQKCKRIEEIFGWLKTGHRVAQDAPSRLFQWLMTRPESGSYSGNSRRLTL